MRKKLLLAIIFTFVGSIISILLSLFSKTGLIGYATDANAFLDVISNQYQPLIDQAAEVSDELLQQVLSTITAIVLVADVATIIVAIACIVFASISCTLLKLSNSAILVRRKKVFLILLIVLNGVSILFASILTMSFYIVSMILVILELKDIRNGRRNVKTKIVENNIDNGKVIDEDNYQRQDAYDYQDRFEGVKETPVTDGVKEENENVEEVNMEEIYTLLAKLEHQYKNGELSKEDYERMKNQILSNINNK